MSGMNCAVKITNIDMNVGKSYERIINNLMKGIGIIVPPGNGIWTQVGLSIKRSAFA